jgi:hypothetical protein
MAFRQHGFVDLQFSKHLKRIAMKSSTIGSCVVSTCIAIGIFTAIFGLHSLIFGKSDPLRNPIAAVRHPPSEVVRFATEGRAQLQGVRMATDRSALVTVAALSEVFSSREKPPAYRVVDENGWYITQTAEAVRAILVIHHQSRGNLTIIYQTHDPSIHQSVQHAVDFISAVVAAQWLPKSAIRVHALQPGVNRAYATGLGGNASIHLQPGVVDVSTAIHELAHHIEGDHPWILELSKRFIARRARGGPPERLKDITGHNYEHNEITHRSNWSTRGGSHYIGKFYGPSLQRATATEAISMGLERLYREPDAFYPDFRC